MGKFLAVLGFWSGVLLPFWNIPLLYRVIKRKSSEDMSLAWLFGVWGCIAGLLPSSLRSHDPVFKAFGVSNAILFSLVVIVVLRYHRPKK